MNPFLEEKKMWQCECGEFNNDELSYCIACNKVRIEKKKEKGPEKIILTTDSMFRRIQDFILFDIAFTALIAVYCFWRGKNLEAFEGICAIIVLILFQLLLVINLLRMFYNAVINAERNTFFLQKIYEIMRERKEIGEEASKQE